MNRLSSAGSITAGTVDMLGLLTIHRTCNCGWVRWAGEEVTTDANLEVARVWDVSRRGNDRVAVGNIYFDVTATAAVRLVGLDAESNFVV